MSGKLIWGAFIVSTLMMNASCIEISRGGGDDDDFISRTVLVYMAADNNLSVNADANIYSMKSSMKSVDERMNLLALVDKRGSTPSLLHITYSKIDTIKSYKDIDCTDPDVLREIIDYVVQNYKTDSYGLLMWSHGTGWIPTDKLHYVAPNMRYVQARDGYMPTSDAWIMDYQRYPSTGYTKAFAWEDIKGAKRSYKCMDMNDMVNAIPDGVFDFILFDACYMANVEVIYALRHKARYIISSCYEIVSYGMPYHTATKEFMNSNLMKVCRDFYSYYNGQSDWRQMGGISLVNTDGMDSLAACFKKIVDGREDMVSSMNVDDIQCFDRFTNHVFYDLEDVVSKLNPQKDDYIEFKQQLMRCVPYAISTPYIFPGDSDSIKVDKYCGMSVFIPISKYDASGLNNNYRNLEWSKSTGY